MPHLWVLLCLLWQGTCSFMIHNTIESLCLEDSLEGDRVHLKKCNLDSGLQRWSWVDQWFLANTGTQKCLSAYHDDPVQTVPCNGGHYLQWQCLDHRLISLNKSLELSADREHLALSQRSKMSKWRSLDEGDICQDRLRSKRASSEPNEFEFVESEEKRLENMTEEQRAYLQWYYRTEDPSNWMFAMLALSFGALLVGCMLLLMGTMSNRSRKKIAKYKAAALAAKPWAEELQVITEVVAEVDRTYAAPTQDSQSNSKPPADGCKSDKLKPGKILVTWKDGNVSNLYPEAAEEVKGAAEEVKGAEDEVKGAAEEVKGAEDEVKGAAEEKGAVEEEKGAAEEVKGAAEEKGAAEKVKGVSEEATGAAEKGDGARL